MPRKKKVRPNTPPTGDRVNRKMLGLQLFKKNNPQDVKTMTDEELMAYALGSKEAAAAVLEKCGSVESLHLCEGGRQMMNHPAIGLGRATMLEVIYEIAARINGAEREAQEVA